MLRTPFYRVIEEHIAKKPESKWFSKGAMKFFDSTLPKYAYLKINDLYFITGEKSPMDVRRKYSIRKMTNDGQISTVGEFNEVTRMEARRTLAKMLACKQKDL